MPNESHVVDENNIPLAIVAIQGALEDGMKNLHEDILSQVLSNWEQGMDATGTPWAELADSTIEAKGGSDILVSSGELRNDVRQSSRYDSRTKSSIITSSLPYAGVHEFGMPEQGIPARPFLAPAAKYAQQQVESEIGARIDKELSRVTVGRF